MWSGVLKIKSGKLPHLINDAADEAGTVVFCGRRELAAPFGEGGFEFGGLGAMAGFNKGRNLLQLSGGGGAQGDLGFLERQAESLPFLEFGLFEQNVGHQAESLGFGGHAFERGERRAARGGEDDG